MTETTEESGETIPFYPDHISTEARVMLAILLVVVAIAALGLFFPVGLEEQADPLKTPPHTKPEWYFLGLYQLLKFIPKIAGVLIPIIGLITLFFWPFLDRAPDSKKQRQKRVIITAVFTLLMIGMTIWGWVS